MDSGDCGEHGRGLGTWGAEGRSNNQRRRDPLEYRGRRCDKLSRRISKVARRFLGTNSMDVKRTEGLCYDQGDYLEDDRVCCYGLGPKKR